MTIMTAAQRRAAAVQALNDETRLVVSLSQAAFLVGVAVSTAFRAARTTGYLISGVPVIRIAGTKRERWVVSKDQLRSVLQRDEVRS
jgi:hypothetical protein